MELNENELNSMALNEKNGKAKKKTETEKWEFLNSDVAAHFVGCPFVLFMIFIFIFFVSLKHFHQIKINSKCCRDTRYTSSSVAPNAISIPTGIFF